MHYRLRPYPYYRRYYSINPYHYSRYYNPYYYGIFGSQFANVSQSITNFGGMSGVSQDSIINQFRNSNVEFSEDDEKVVGICTDEEPPENSEDQFFPIVKPL
jgi:hypothetical protein